MAGNRQTAESKFKEHIQNNIIEKTTAECGGLFLCGFASWRETKANARKDAGTLRVGLAPWRCSKKKINQPVTGFNQP